jgi:hypothetical protein
MFNRLSNKRNETRESEGERGIEERGEGLQLGPPGGGLGRTASDAADRGRRDAAAGAAGVQSML